MQNEDRINVLETQVRTLKRIVYGFGCLLVAGIVVSATSVQTVPDAIQAKSFQAVNDEGKVVAAFYGAAYGGGLNIRNSESKSVVEIYPTVEGGHLEIFNNDGKSCVGIGGHAVGGFVTVKKGEITSSLPK